MPNSLEWGSEKKYDRLEAATAKKCIGKQAMNKQCEYIKKDSTASTVLFAMMNRVMGLVAYFHHRMQSIWNAICI